MGGGDARSNDERWAVAKANHIRWIDCVQSDDFRTLIAGHWKATALLEAEVLDGRGRWVEVYGREEEKEDVDVARYCHQVIVRGESVELAKRHQASSRQAGGIPRHACRCIITPF